MTHLSEAEFRKRVRQWFENQYGVGAVERDVYLPEPRWYCDLLVDVPPVRLYVEAENDADSVREGVAQALGYCGADPRGVPAVVIPAGHLDRTRVARLQSGSGVCILEFDADIGAFV